MKIQVHGAIETNNFGDILLAKLFCQKLIELGHTVIVKNACNEFYECMGNQILTKGTPDKTVFCGGGYLCDGNFKFSLHMIKTIFLHMASCKIKKIPYVIIGAGTKKFKCFATKPFMKWCINGAESIYVRNEQSKLDLEELGVNKEIIVTADNVMAIDESFINKESIEKVKQLLSTLPKNKKNILLHLNYFNIDDNEQITSGTKILYDAIEKYCNSDSNVNYIVCCDHKIDLFVEQCNKIKKLLPIENSKIIISENIDEMLALIYLCDGVVTTKLHVGICAIALNRHVVSFPMHPKTKRFFEQIGESMRCKMLTELNEEDEIIEMIKRGLKQNCNNNKINEIRELSKKNYEFLKEFVGEVSYE